VSGPAGWIKWAINRGIRRGRGGSRGRPNLNLFSHRSLFVYGRVGEIQVMRVDGSVRITRLSLKARFINAVWTCVLAAGQEKAAREQGAKNY
jgi:hypothetical protein